MSGGGGSGGGGTWAKAEAAIAHERVVLFSKTTCGYCGRVRRVLERLGLKAADITEFQLDTVPDGANVQTELHGITGIHTVPNLFISGVCFGGSEDVLDAYDSGALQEALRDAGFDVHEAT